MIRIEPCATSIAPLTLGIPVLSAFVAHWPWRLMPLMPLPGPMLPRPIGEMFKGVFGSTFAFTEMLTRATPLDVHWVWRRPWLFAPNFGTSGPRGSSISGRWRRLP